ncbi:hypothetical protein [Antarcticimicrobium luteum]|uniref:Uncharacterized protein n=1 Tax=Antarcticimicrobium luteum TaxID=2547397 RepID=A0A4R5USV0_9RHOB|nr:hypothetical protein [Antarcticimicrobium luteum]TDK42192.1 hypothetical protein E1832_18795 [Antarcticimicrobium luteum]
MKHILIIALAAGALGWAAPAQAGVIERACMQANRKAAPSLCRCIQKVANHSLNALERRKVARWFGDPHQAQEVRQSESAADVKLWERYQAFGEQAAKTCR